MTSMSYSVRLPGGRATFLCVAKERPPLCCVFRPIMDEKSVRAGRACRRAIHGAAASGRNPLRSRFARVRFAPPAGLFVRPSPQHRGPGKALLRWRPSWPCSKRDRAHCFVRHARRMRAEWGPSDAARALRKCPQGGAQEVRQFAAGTGMCRRRTPPSAREPAAHGWAKGASAGWPFSW